MQNLKELIENLTQEGIPNLYYFNIIDDDMKPFDEFVAECYDDSKSLEINRLIVLEEIDNLLKHNGSGWKRVLCQENLTIKRFFFQKGNFYLYIKPKRLSGTVGILINYGSEGNISLKEEQFDRYFSIRSTKIIDLRNKLNELDNI